MKIAYFHKREAEYLPLFPPDIGLVQVQARDDDGAYSREQMLAIGDCEAIFPVGAFITEQVFAAARSLRIVQVPGAGYDKVDLAAASRRGVVCCSNGSLNGNRVADFAMMMILNLFGNCIPAARHMTAADWDSARKAAQGALDVEGKVLGIIGFGGIGARLALRAHAFEMRVVYADAVADANRDIAKRIGARRMERDELLSSADVVSIHTSLNHTSRRMMAAPELALMKAGAFLVCTARGGIIDEDALAEALDAGRLAGAAIDVFAAEPIRPENPLLRVKNTILTPHMAGMGRENIEKSFRAAIANIRDFVERGRSPSNVLNPDVLRTAVV
jgi:lactate dehydrogenase-like 2-hydroxyacid dehydrogenase